MGWQCNSVNGRQFGASSQPRCRPAERPGVPSTSVRVRKTSRVSGVSDRMVSNAPTPRVLPAALPQSEAASPASKECAAVNWSKQRLNGSHVGCESSEGVEQVAFPACQGAPISERLVIRSLRESDRARDRAHSCQGLPCRTPAPPSSGVRARGPGRLQHTEG